MHTRMHMLVHMHVHMHVHVHAVHAYIDACPLPLGFVSDLPLFVFFLRIYLWALFGFTFLPWARI